MIAVVVGLLVAVSALGLGGAAAALPVLAPGERPAWMLFGFEVVSLVASVLVVLFGRGRFADGPGLALGTLAGTLLVASAFGWVSAGRQLAGVSLTPVLGFRVLAAAGLGACGAYCVLSRDRRSWGAFVIGAACGAPFALVSAAALTSRGRGAMLAFVSGGGIVQAVVAIVAVVVIGGLLCASVHMIVKAFEMGRVDGKGGARGAEAAPKSASAERETAGV